METKRQLSFGRMIGLEQVGEAGVTRHLVKGGPVEKTLVTDTLWMNLKCGDLMSEPLCRFCKGSRSYYSTVTLCDVKIRG